MIKKPKIFYGLLIFTACIMVFILQNPAVSQQVAPIIPGVPENSVILEIKVSEDMIRNNYYYRICYVANGNWPMPIIFYNKQFRQRFPEYSAKEINPIWYNKFQIIDSWARLKAGEYLIAFVSTEPRLPSQGLIQTVKVSSNAKKALEDKHTLIVDDSVGVAPEKGSNSFNIRYELNETSNMTHKVRPKESKDPIWSEERSNVPKGTRGFEYDRQKAKKGFWYRAVVEAVSTVSTSKWDHDLSRPFQVLEQANVQ